MIHNDYSQAKRIAHDWIRWPCVRVSTVEIPSFLDGAPFGHWYETMVFSECPYIKIIQRSFDLERDALRAHGHIINNLKKILKEQEVK